MTNSALEAKRAFAVQLGVPELAATRGIREYNGHLTVSPAVMSGMIRGAGHKLRVRRDGTVQGGDLAVTVTAIRSDDPDFEYSFTWTPHDAVAAGLATAYTADEHGVWHVQSDRAWWREYPARVCQWRAIGDVATAGFEDLFWGVHLSPEELGATTDADGNLVDAAPAAPASPTKPWMMLVREASTVDAVHAVLGEATQLGERTPVLITAAYARIGVLSRAAETEKP